MTFGKIKSIIENDLLESYKNEKEFKQSLKEFRQNVLNNKNMSKLYSLYDQLTTPQGLNESDAKDFLEEGISLIQKLIPSIKTPKTLSENVKNKYSDIDSLVYTNKLDLMERIKSKKALIKTLSSSKDDSVKESINIPLKSMVNIANQTMNSYLENLDESTKKEFLSLMNEDTSVLKEKFETLRETTINKLGVILENEKEFEMKTKLSETIDRLKVENFNQLNFLKLKNLEESI
jgi:predicted RND superfamily exporter protein